MSITALTAYVLVWPIIATGVLIVLVASVVRDMREAARKDERLV
jgi:hypothetical protein